MYISLNITSIVISISISDSQHMTTDRDNKTS